MGRHTEAVLVAEIKLCSTDAVARTAFGVGLCGRQPSYGGDYGKHSETPMTAKLRPNCSVFNDLVDPINYWT